VAAVAPSFEGEVYAGHEAEGVRESAKVVLTAESTSVMTVPRLDDGVVR
jgi:hypothetical protein